MVSLRPIDESNREAVEALRVSPGQEQFVSSVADSMLEAAEEPHGRALYWAVYSEKTPVGFVMISDEVGSPDYMPQYLWKLLIDERHQRQGFGTATLDLIVEYFRGRPGVEVLKTSAGQGDGSPITFYERYGFVRTGEIVFDNEVLLRLELRRPTVEEQLDQVLAAVRDVLGPAVVGAYLHGSAVLGELRPRSDIDVLVVSGRRTSHEEKRRLVDHLLSVSGGEAPGPPRPVELTIVVESEVRPWRYPASFDFQYGEWLRHEFESGNAEPWPTTTNPDLASLIAMVLLADKPLLGPAPGEVFEPVPRSDYTRAMVGGIDALLHDLDSDTRNVILTLARIWGTVATGEIRSKEAAAAWALARLPQDHRAVLARARAIYLGDEEERWDDVKPHLQPHVDYVGGEIALLAANATSEGTRPALPMRGRPTA